MLSALWIRWLQYAFLAIIVTTVGFSLYQWNASRASTQKTAPNNGLVGYWSFDEGSGTQAGDASGNNNTGTLTNGPTWTTGKLGQAINFDGVNDYVNVPSPVITAYPATITAWLKLPAGAAGGFPITITDSGDYSAWGIQAYTNQIKGFTAASYQGADSYLSLSVDATQWTFVSFVLTNATSRTLYVNNLTPVTDTTNRTPVSLDVLNVGRIGGFWASHGFDNWFTGQVDEVRIYNRALSGTEVTNLYNLGIEKLNVSPTASLTSGLVGYWTFDGKDTPWSSSSAGTATDRSGNGNTGTLTNMSRTTTPAEGKLGQALSFNGTNQYVTVPNAASLNVSTTVTYSAWVKPASLAATNTVFRKTVSSLEDKYMYISTAGIVSCLLYSTTTALASIQALSVGNWYLLTETYDGTTQKIYINGVLDNSKSASGDVADSTGAFNIGFDVGNNYYFNGLIDEVRIYNRALSAGEVQSLYDLGASDKVNSSVSQNQGVGRLDSGLVGYWKLDDASGTTATDSSTNANSGTLTNGPSWSTGKILGALDFSSASSQRITVSHSTTLNVYPMTASAWVKTTTNDSSGRGVLGKYTSGQANGYLLDLYQGHIRAWYFKNGSNYVYNGGQGLDGGSVNDGVWHFVSLVVDSSGGRLFVDGVQRDSRAWTGTPGTMTWTGPLCIGLFATNNTDCTAGSFFDGSIDEARVYNRALSTDEIVQLYRLTAPTAVDTSLKGYWSFNGSDISGTTAYDRSGAGNNGTLTNGPTVTEGKLGQALNFDGVNQYISMSGVPVTSFPFTTIVWFKTTNATASYRTISSLYGNANSAIAIIQFDLPSACASSSRVKYIVRDNAAGASASICSLSNLNDGVWHQAVGVNASASDHKFYVDGVLQGSSVTALGTTTFNSMQVSSYNATQYFPGSADEVRVYNRALSSTEVSALYNAGR